MKAKELKLLYEKLLRVVEIPVIESELLSNGFYHTERGEPKIYVRKDLTLSEKLKVLLHEYVHHAHITKYYENESRESCEIIAGYTAFFVCRDLGLHLFKKREIENLCNNNPDKAASLLKSQKIANEIINQINSM